MEDIAWYVKQRTQMQEILWFMLQRSRSLQNYRSENHGRWDDQAALEINNRYLDPHFQDTEAMLNYFSEQLTALTQSDVHIELAYDSALEINKLSEKINFLLSLIYQDIQTSYSDYDNYLQNNLTAKNIIPTITSLISSANNFHSARPSY